MQLIHDSWDLNPGLNYTEIKKKGDFPGGPGIKTPCFHCRRCRFKKGDGTQAHGSEIAKSQPLDRQGIPYLFPLQ